MKIYWNGVRHVVNRCVVGDIVTNCRLWIMHRCVSACQIISRLSPSFIDSVVQSPLVVDFAAPLFFPCIDLNTAEKTLGNSSLPVCVSNYTVRRGTRYPLRPLFHLPYPSSVPPPLLHIHFLTAAALKQMRRLNSRWSHLFCYEATAGISRREGYVLAVLEGIQCIGRAGERDRDTVVDVIKMTEAEGERVAAAAAHQWQWLTFYSACVHLIALYRLMKRNCHWLNITSSAILLSCASQFVSKWSSLKVLYLDQNQFHRGMIKSCCLLLH